MTVATLLPRGTEPPGILSYNAANVPVAQLNVCSDTLSGQQLFDYAYNSFHQARLGLRLICKPQAGETVVVAAASGPVGSLVGQLAKAAGARAVGIAGRPEKCAYVKNELRFDAAIDHHAADFPAQLAGACPKGIDVYFENVGGAVWQAVLPLLNNLDSAQSFPAPVEG